MKSFRLIFAAAAALTVAGCAIEQTHLLGTAWKDTALDTNGTESGGGKGGGKK